MKRCILIVACAVLASFGCARDDAETYSVRVDRQTRTVFVPAVVQAGQYDGNPNPRHHLLTWSKGARAKNALFVTPLSDRAILETLEALGGKPGNNLTRETWESAGDPDCQDPDLHATGDPIEVQVMWAGRTAPLPLSEIFPKGELRWVLAGNEALIPVWNSGCVCCMQSCPGAKVANAAYTMRQYVQGKGRLQLKPGILPPDGTEVIIRISLISE